MPWRIIVPDVRYLYSIVCPDCQHLCGWPNRRQAERHLIELADDGRQVQRWYVSEYELGDDKTCEGHRFGTLARWQARFRRDRRGRQR